MSRRFRVIHACALTVTLTFGAVSADARPSDKARATRAVRAEIQDRYVSFQLSDVTCVALTTRRFKCTYVGLVPSADGPCRGTARARVHASAVDVTSVSRYRCDF